MEISFDALSGEALVVVTPPDRLRTMVKEHLAFTWRTLRRLGLPPDVADDATQRVFLVASGRLGDIDVGRERAFLFQTAVRVASSEKRGFARRREVFEEVSVPDGAPGADERLDQARARQMLDEILAELDVELRTVFVLFELEEMGTDDIAALLDLPRGTVASRLRRAREAFQAAAARKRARERHMATRAR